MKLYQRDLRTQQIAYDPHLPASMKCVVVCFYIFLGIGITGLGALGLQLWKSNQQAGALQAEILKTNEQQVMLESVIDRITARQELVSDIQAWLQNRYDLESVYHECVRLVPRGMLLQSFVVKHIPNKSTLEFSITVEGDSSSYNQHFRALTSYFTNAPNLKIADIQIDVRPGGALLTLEIMTNETVAVVPDNLPKLTQIRP